MQAYCARYGKPDVLVVSEEAARRADIDALASQVPARDVLIVSPRLWSQLAQSPPAVAVLAAVTTPAPHFETAADFCLLLEAIQDPGNLGSILRSAAAAGVAQVFLSPGCAFAWSPKVLRAAQGGHFHLEIFEEVDLVGWAGRYRGNVVATVAAGGESLFGADLTAPIAIAIGNEGTGLSPELRAAASSCVSIPMPGGFESLNAAAAAAVCLFECVRRR